MRKNKTGLWIIGMIIIVGAMLWGYRLWSDMANDVDIITINTEAPYEEGCETNNEIISDDLTNLMVEMMDEEDIRAYFPFIEVLEEEGYNSSDFRGTKAKKDGKDHGVMTYFVMTKDDKKIQFNVQNTYVPSCGTIDLSTSQPSILHGDEVYLFQNQKQTQAFAIKDEVRYSAYFDKIDIQEAVSVMKMVLKQP